MGESGAFNKNVVQRGSIGSGQSNLQNTHIQVFRADSDYQWTRTDAIPRLFVTNLRDCRRLLALRPPSVSVVQTSGANPPSQRPQHDGNPQFQALLAPEDQEIAQLTALLAEHIVKLFQRRGLGPASDPEESDPLSRDQPWLAGLYAASVSGKTAFGLKAGRRVTRIGDQIDPESMDALASPRCARVAGFSLHANTAVPAGDRQRLERLARYCARPPIAMERLELLADGRLRYRIKRPWRG